MFGAPDVWDALMRKIAGIAAAYLRIQVEAGASAVQLFDSWAGALTPADYRASVMPHSERVLAAAGELGVPRIHFGVGTTNLLGLMGEAGADVVGVDWRTPLEHAIPLVGDRAVQGNLDPTLVFAPTEVMTAPRGRGDRRRPGGEGPHLQPRPRSDPLDRPRSARGAHRLRARLPIGVTTGRSPLAAGAATGGSRGASSGRSAARSTPAR